GIGACQDNGIQHGLGPARLDLPALVEVIEHLVRAVGLRAALCLLDQPGFLCRRDVDMHDASQHRARQRVSQPRVARYARRLRVSGLELGTVGEPQVHSLIEIRGGRGRIPAARPVTRRGCLVRSDGCSNKNAERPYKRKLHGAERVVSPNVPAQAHQTWARTTDPLCSLTGFDLRLWSECRTAEARYLLGRISSLPAEPILRAT